MTPADRANDLLRRRHPGQSWGEPRPADNGDTLLVSADRSLYARLLGTGWANVFDTRDQRYRVYDADGIERAY